MNLVAYTATALSRNDITDTPTNKNIVDGAIVELKDLDGNLVVIYDDESGSNPETQKSCNANGQLTFWTEVGDYILIINGEVNFITIGASVKFTKQSRQAIEAVYKAQGYNNVFFFEDGFTYTESNDVGIYEDGSAWTYADAGAFPVTVTAGTVPSEGVYKGVKVVLPPFDTVADMESATYLSTLPEDTNIVWNGYYVKGDGGGNSGLLKFGAHTEDGGSIFSIDANTYIEASHKDTIDPVEFGCGFGGDDTQQMMSFLDYLVANNLDAKSSPNKNYNVTDLISAEGTGSEVIEFDLSGSVISINSSTLRAVEFKNLKELTTKNLRIKGNGGEHFGLVCESIDTIHIEPTTSVEDLSCGEGAIIAGVFIRDCMNGEVKPAVSNIVNTPLTVGVSRGVMVSDRENTECNLVITPTINNIPGTADGDGVYVEYSGFGDQSTIRGGVKVINGVYNNCGKRNIKIHMPNSIVTGNVGNNDNEEPMYAFISAYGGSSVITGNKFSCEKPVNYKVEILSDLLPSSEGASYTISSNQFFAGKRTDNAGDYLLNIQVSNTSFDSITLSSNQDKGAGRCIRGFNSNVGRTMVAKSNELKDTSDTVFNLSNITLTSLIIDGNSVEGVSNRYLAALSAASIDFAIITNNGGNFPFGTVQADDDFRPINMHGNGSIFRSTGSNSTLFYDGVKRVFRNNNDPTSGRFLVGDEVINNNPSPTGWASKVCTTEGVAGVDAVFKIDRAIES